MSATKTRAVAARQTRPGREGTKVRTRCSAGERCASHAALGEPAKLSRGNPGPLCFACEERRAASAPGKAANVKPAAVPRDDRRPLAQGKGRRSEVRTGGVGKAHACSEARRARGWQEGRSMWALTCDRNLRDALASGDWELTRKWSGLLEEAKSRLALAEADLAAKEARAHR